MEFKIKTPTEIKTIIENNRQVKRDKTIQEYIKRIEDSLIETEMFAIELFDNQMSNGLAWDIVLNEFTKAGYDVKVSTRAQLTTLNYIVIKMMRHL